MIMDCRDVTQRLQPYLDDLLQEDDYQAIRVHLDGCVKCRDHVRAIGSLTSAVNTLGELEVPQDLGAAILFRLKQRSKIVESPKASRPRRPVIVGTVLVVLVGGTIILGVVSTRGRGGSPQPVAQPVVTAQWIRTSTPPSDAEAQHLLASLQAIADGLEAKAPEQPSVSEPSESEASASAEPPLLNWTISFILPKQREVRELIEHLGGTVDQASEHSLQFLIPGSQVTKLAQQIQGMSGVDTDIINADIEPYVDEDVIRMTLKLLEKYATR